MRSHFRFSLIVALLFSLRCVSAQTPAGTLAIRGDVQNPIQWTADELKAKFAGQVQDIKFAGMDRVEKTGSGVPLLSVIQAAGLKVDQGAKHHDMAFLAIVEASDSYLVFFTIPELMPKVGHAQAWILWSVDGKPLSGKEAPFRLIVSTDSGPDRNIYGITKITLVDGIKLANQLK
jgi:hypothetical protein